MRSIWLVLVVLSMGLPALSGHAQAQHTVEAQARALFDQGVAASDEERWADAAARFEQSLGLLERPSTVFNLIGALYRVGRYEEGLRFVQRYLEITDPVSDAARRQEAEALKEVIEKARVKAESAGGAAPEPQPRVAPVSEPEPAPLVSAPTGELVPRTQTTPDRAPTPNKRRRRALWITGSLVVVGALTATLLLTSRDGEPSGPACGADTTAGRCIAF